MRWILIFSSSGKHILSKPVDFSIEIRRFLRVDQAKSGVWEQQKHGNKQGCGSRSTRIRLYFIFDK